MAGNAELINASIGGRRRLTVPTLAISSYPIRAGLQARRKPLADDLAAVTIDDCGHAISLNRPEVPFDAVPSLSRTNKMG